MKESRNLFRFEIDHSLTATTATFPENYIFQSYLPNETDYLLYLQYNYIFLLPIGIHRAK